MATRKHTLRTMSPAARKLARLANDLESVLRRLRNSLPEIEHIEMESRALRRGQPRLATAAPVEPADSPA